MARRRVFVSVRLLSKAHGLVFNGHLGHRSPHLPRRRARIGVRIRQPRFRLPILQWTKGSESCTRPVPSGVWPLPARREQRNHHPAQQTRTSACKCAQVESPLVGSRPAQDPPTSPASRSIRYRAVRALDGIPYEPSGPATKESSTESTTGGNRRLLVCETRAKRNTRRILTLMLVLHQVILGTGTICAFSPLRIVAHKPLPRLRFGLVCGWCKPAESARAEYNLSCPVHRSIGVEGELSFPARGLSCGQQPIAARQRHISKVAKWQTVNPRCPHGGSIKFAWRRGCLSL